MKKNSTIRGYISWSDADLGKDGRAYHNTSVSKNKKNENSG